MNLKGKVLILGASGLLGSELISGPYFNKHQIISQSLKSNTDFKVDLEDYDNVTNLLEQVQPDIILNLVALTNVDDCEKFPSRAYRLNVEVVTNIVNAIQKFSFKPYLIHISTDQVYDSEGISSEKNINLSNYYSWSKFCGELIASKTNSTILRTNFFGKSKNLLRSSLTDWIFNELKNGNKINVFEDISFNPLSINNLCKIIEFVAEKKIEGIFNLGSNNGMNKSDFAFQFAKILNLPTSNLNKIRVSDAKFSHTHRAKNMLMNLNKFENKFNIKLPNLIEEIELVTKEYL